MNKLWLSALALPALLMATPLMASPARGADLHGVAHWIGQPKIVVGKSIAAFGWQDKARGLHLRVTAPVRRGRAYHYAGTVCALGKQGANRIASLKPVLLEKGADSARVGPKGHCVWFSFMTGGHIDGFDFTTPARHLLFTIKLDGKKLGTQHIHIGAQNHHPPSNPVVLKR